MTWPLSEHSQPRASPLFRRQQPRPRNRYPFPRPYPLPAALHHRAPYQSPRRSQRCARRAQTCRRPRPRVTNAKSRSGLLPRKTKTSSTRSRRHRRDRSSPLPLSLYQLLLPAHHRVSLLRLPKRRVMMTTPWQDPPLPVARGQRPPSHPRPIHPALFARLGRTLLSVEVRHQPPAGVACQRYRRSWRCPRCHDGDSALCSWTSSSG